MNVARFVPQGFRQLQRAFPQGQRLVGHQRVVVPQHAVGLDAGRQAAEVMRLGRVLAASNVGIHPTHDHRAAFGVGVSDHVQRALFAG